jgi:hypothetical protein
MNTEDLLAKLTPVTRFIHRANESAARPWHGLHGDEVQKSIRAEDGEHKSEQDAGNDGDDFHGALLNRIGDFSIIFQTSKSASVVAVAFPLVYDMVCPLIGLFFEVRLGRSQKWENCQTNPSFISVKIL